MIVVRIWLRSQILTILKKLGEFDYLYQSDLTTCTYISANPPRY
jgi:hypothetical protein